MTTEQTYGQTTLAKLNEMLVGEDKATLRCTAGFWAWRKENESRSRVLNEAGLVLWKAESGWLADMTKVSTESLDAAREKNIERKAEQKEWDARAKTYTRSCDRARRRNFGRY